MALFVSAAAAQTREDLKKPFSPAAEKVLTEVVDKAAPEKRKQLESLLEQAVRQIDSVAKLTPEERAVLDREAVKIIDVSIQHWRARFAEALRTYLPRHSDTLVIRYLRQPHAEDLTTKIPLENWRPPDEEPAWHAKVRLIVGEQRFASWRVIADEGVRKRDVLVDGHVKTWGEEYRKSLDRSIQTKINRLPERLRSTPERVERFKVLRSRLVERLLGSEQNRVRGMLRSLPLVTLEQLIETSSLDIRFALLFGTELDTTWKDELKHELTAEEFEAWQNQLAEEKAQFDKDLPGLLKPRLDEMREMWQQGLDLTIADMGRILSLTEERAKAFEPAAKAGIEAAERKWMVLAKNQVEMMDGVGRQNVIERGGVYVALEEEDLPHSSAIWKEATQKILTPAELKLLESTYAERIAKRNQILARILIAELDQKVAFTAIQREHLRPVAERLVKGLLDIYQMQMPTYGMDIAPQMFFQAAKDVPEAEMLTLLDQVQWGHWQETCRAASKVRQPGRAGAAVPQRKPEPEEVEHRISTYLHERCEAEKRRLLGEMLLRIEDVNRVVPLPEQADKRLRTAAKGAVEYGLLDWKVQAEQTVRNQVQAATPEDVQQRLDALQDYNFSGRRSGQPALHEIWTSAVKATLNESQRAEWQKELDARKDYYEQTIALAGMLEFDRRYRLTNAQWDKLLPLVVRIVKEYNDTIQTYFSNPTPWYLQNHSSLIPFAGLPEADLKPILGKQQWDRWAGEGLANTSHYWDNIKAMQGRKKQ
ncbi:MAG TPA: hypothetical protein VD994_20400 [Prosthecobacter sp.]|nr:hypothetical protein [Prosthecobacter sp.]